MDIEVQSISKAIRRDWQWPIARGRVAFLLAVLLAGYRKPEIFVVAPI